MILIYYIIKIKIGLFEDKGLVMGVWNNVFFIIILGIFDLNLV